jgi:hypothetical protein
MPSSRFPPESEADRERWADIVAKSVSDTLTESFVSRSEIQAIAKTAAESAAKEALQGFSDRLGIGDAKGVEAFLMERAHTRWRMEIGQQVFKQGIGAVILALISAMGVALMFWLRSGLPK